MTRRQPGAGARRLPGSRYSGVRAPGVAAASPSYGACASDVPPGAPGAFPADDTWGPTAFAGSVPAWAPGVRDGTQAGAEGLGGAGAPAAELCGAADAPGVPGGPWGPGAPGPEPRGGAGGGPRPSRRGGGAGGMGAGGAEGGGR